MARLQFLYCDGDMMGERDLFTFGVEGFIAQLQDSGAILERLSLAHDPE
jgi:hypothetical protein